MPNVLVIRDQITDALSSALRKGDHGLSVVPGLLRRAIKEKAWGERIVHQTRQRIPAFSSLRVYIETSPPEGLGATCDMIERLIKDDAEALALFRKGTTSEAHRPGRSNNNVMTSARQGNNLAYTLDRLKREAPLLFDAVKRKELSANAAAIKAGFRRKLSPLEQILKLLPKLTIKERVMLRRELDGSRSQL